MAVDLFKLQGSVEVNTGKAEADLKRVDLAARRTQSALSQTDQAGKKAGSGITAGFNSSVASANRLSGLLSSLQSKLSSLKAPSLNLGGMKGGGGFDVAGLVKGNLITSALSAATGGLTDAMKQGWSAGIEYNKMLEKASISFTTLLGSTDKAQSHLKALQAFGEATPFEFPDLIKASQRMQAMGFSAESVIPSLRAIGDAVSAVGGGKEELDGVVMALGQMQTKGKVSAEEMNQLAERGIPAWDLLAKAIGKTKEETIKLSEQGRLSGGRAVQGITAMMGERFGGQMDKMSATLEGRESNFNDILNRQLGSATEGNFGQLREAYLKAATGLGTDGAKAFGVELNKMLTDVGKLAETDLQKVASGDIFKQGASAVSTVGKIGGQLGDAGKAFDEGRYMDAAKGVGGAIGEGLRVGLGESKDPVDKAVYDFFNGIITQAKGILGVQSPSKVFMAIGANVGDGFNNGINDSINRSSDGIKKWAKAIADAGGEEFLKAVEEVSRRLKIDPNKLLNVMAFESGLDPSKKNPNSSATGLIQFMNSTATQLGTTTADLKGMNAIEQLKYVEAYFKQFKSLVDTQEAIYTAVLAGRPVSDPESVLFSKGGKSTGRAYSANAALDKDSSGTITAREAAAQAYKQGFLSVETSASKTSGMLDQLSSAIESAKSQITSMAASIAQYVGFGAAPPAAAPIARAVPQQQKQSPQTVQGGQLGGATTAAKAEALTLSADAKAAASSIGSMSVSAKTVATESVKTTEALKATGSQAGAFADAIMDVGQKTKEAIDHFAGFKDAFASGIDDIFDGNFNAKNFGKSLLKNLSGGLISQATGGAASSPGEFFSKALFGGLSGGGGMSGVPATGGFAGGGGAADVLKGAAGSMNFGKLPGMGKVGGFLSKIPFFGKLFGGGASAATGAAGAATTGAAAGGGGFMSGLLGAAGGHVGLIAGLAMPLVGKLFGLFGGNPLKDYKKLVKGEYGISISDQVASKIMQAGQSKFGNEWQKRKIETVRLPEIRDMLSEYSGAFQKGGNDKLFDSRMFSDQFSAVNQIKVPMRANGGRVRGGKPYLVGERQAEIFVPYSDGQVMPNAGRGGMFSKGIEEVLARVAQALDRFESMPAEQVVVTGISRRPGIAAADVRQDFERRGEHSQRMREILAAR